MVMKIAPKTPSIPIRPIWTHWLCASCRCLSSVDIHSSRLANVITLSRKHQKITFAGGSTYRYTDATASGLVSVNHVPVALVRGPKSPAVLLPGEYVLLSVPEEFADPFDT